MNNGREWDWMDEEEFINNKFSKKIKNGVFWNKENNNIYGFIQ